MSTDDITTRPGFIAKSRKAFVAGIGAAAASIGPAIAVAGADGVLDLQGEILPLGIIGLTLGVAAGLAVFATPNAQG